MADRLLVLCYHNVRGTWCFPSSGDTGPQGLERQLRALRRVATVLPLDEALARLSQGRPLPRAAVALTFDDGYTDNLTLAAPLLERLSLPATFFLVPGLLSRTVSAWWETVGWAFCAATRSELVWEGTCHRLGSEPERAHAQAVVAAALKRRNRAAREDAVYELVRRLAPSTPAPGPDLFLDWEGARRLVARGHAVGSHSSYHAILSQETEAEQTDDLVQARRQLEGELGVPTPILAYPNGTVADYDAATLRAVARAGHSFAMTTVEGFNGSGTPPYEIRRSFMVPQRGLVDLLANLRYLARGARGRIARSISSTRNSRAEGAVDGRSGDGMTP